MTELTINHKSPYCFKYGVIRWFFILCGGQLYLNWILPTNPMSKNPLIKFLWGWMKMAYCGRDYNGRYWKAYLYFTIHFIFCVVNFIDGQMFSLGNILVNIYPMIVQMWIGYRCWRVRRIKKLRITVLV